MKKIIILLGALTVSLAGLRAQNVTVQDAVGQSPETFVLQHLLGDGNGVYIFNVEYNGSPSPISSPQIGTFDANGFLGLEMQHGLVMTTGNVYETEIGSNVTGWPVTPYYTDSLISGSFACSTLDFDFVCQTNTFSFKYCFTSFEYDCCVASLFRDEFDFYLSGPDVATGEYVTQNIALVPGSDGLPVNINTINNGQPGPFAWFYDATWTNAYTSLYVERDSLWGVSFPGWTTKLTAVGQVLPCEVYHMHLSICNVNDNDVDSGVFLESNSFSSPSAQIGLTRHSVDTIPGSCGLEVPLTLAQTAAFDEGIVHFASGGDAVYGTDYELVDELGRSLDSTGLAIDNDVHSIVVRALPGADLSEPKSVELYLQTSLCPQFPELVTHDTMRFVLVRGGDVAVADTTITCSQACFEVSAPLVYGDEPVSYRWEPTTGLEAPYSRTTRAAIFESTDYMLIATGGSGCNSDTALVHVVVTGDNPEPPVGLEEVGGQRSEVSVWPNPAGDMIHVEAEGLRSVELYNLEGRRLGTYTATGATLDIATEGLANGTYGLRVVTAEGSMGAKIVVNK